MIRIVNALSGALLLALAMGFAASAQAQSVLEAKSGDAFYYRHTGGVPPQ